MFGINRIAMELFSTYLVRNFILITIAVVMFIHGIQRYKEHPVVSAYIFAIMGLALSFSVLEILEDYFRQAGIVLGATITSCLMYALRPVYIILFLLLSGINYKSKLFWILMIPLLLNVVVFILPLIPTTSDWVFHFTLGPSGTALWVGGTTYLRYTSHIVSAFYFAYLLFRTIRKLQTRHYSQAMTLFICSAVVVSAVIIETFFNDNGDIHLLNTSVCVSAVFYYLYLYMDLSRYDSLTGLLNRKSYFTDFHKMDKEITGIIQFDMNGLKYINDTYGHMQGDKALKTISAIIRSHCTRHMLAYRLGGDEFVVLAVDENEDTIVDALHGIREDLAKTKYYCSAGYAYRREKDTTIEELYRLSESLMYSDKEQFYKSAPFERRKAEIE